MQQSIKATDCEDLAELGCMNQDTIYLVTKEKLMRGIDYRANSDTEGIALPIMSNFDHERAYKQGLGRVGRYNE